MARKKRLSVAAAETKLRDAVGYRVWGDWFLKLIADLPSGVDPSLLDAVLEGYLVEGRLIDLRGMPAVEEAIVRFVERHERELPQAAFVAVALRTGRGPIGPRIHDLLEHTVWTPPHRDAVRAMIVARPEIVEGARAAEAIGDPTSRTSPYLTILAIDSSPDSLDKCGCTCFASTGSTVRSHRPRSRKSSVTAMTSCCGRARASTAPRSNAGSARS